MKGIDPAQLARWFDEHASRLLLYARQCAHGDAAHGRIAEDLVQEVFLSLLEQPEPPANVKAWLFRSLRNAAVSENRSTRRRGRREREVAEIRGTWFESRPEDLIDAGHARQVLSKLPEVSREIVVLRIWGQMTLAEVAATVGMPLSSVYDQYRSALSLIRQELENPCGNRKNQTR